MTMRRTCPFCGNVIRLRNDGTFYNHTKGSQNMAFKTAVTITNKCVGSGLSRAAALLVQEGAELMEHLGFEE